MMDRMKQPGRMLIAALALSAALLAGTWALPATAQTGPTPTGTPAATGRGMMGGSGGMMNGGMMGRSGGMMNGGMMGRGMMGDVDRHFIEQMIPHHQTAIAMADLALQKAQHPELRTLAAAIKQTQTAEIAQMQAWYRQWYGTDVPAASTQGMMGGQMGGCGGMNSDLTALANAPDFDQAFLQQMVPHHRMAVMMASMVPARGTHAELRALAERISSGQSAEITQMRAWYQQWYGAALP